MKSESKGTSKGTLIDSVFGAGQDAPPFSIALSDGK